MGRNWATPVIWFGPALLLLLAVTLYPTAVVIWLSLSRTRYYDVIGWAGLGNYASVLTSTAFCLHLQTSVPPENAAATGFTP